MLRGNLASEEAITEQMNRWRELLIAYALEYRTTETVRNKKRTRIDFRPKREQDLNDFIATFLRYDLQDRHVVVNREVEITRTGLPGDRTDIQVHAHLPAGAGPETLTIVIETKDCWNREIDTGLVDQLAERYLHRRGLRAGIYLVGYFDDPRWSGRSDHNGHGIEHILETQQAFAEKAAETFGVSEGSGPGLPTARPPSRHAARTRLATVPSRDTIPHAGYNPLIRDKPPDTRDPLR